MADGGGLDEPQEAVAGLATRLTAIESQPLADRAEGFGRLHDELRRVLEGAPASHDASGSSGSSQAGHA